MTDVIDAPATVKPINHWIGGKAAAGRSGRTGPVFNPATGEQTGAVDFATVEEVDQAVQTAKAAFAGLARDVALEADGALLHDPGALPRAPRGDREAS